MICKLCNRSFTANNALSIHIFYSHDISIKEYYDKFLKIENEEICKFCGGEASFSGHLTAGYLKICKNKKCINELRQETNINKYGVSFPMKNDEIKNKARKTVFEKYGGFTLKSKSLKEKVEKTNLEKYGVKNPYQSNEIKEKIKKTIKDKFDVDNVSKSEKIKESKRKTCLKNYGVEYPSQDPSIFESIQKSSLQIKKFNDTNIWYQGSYELDFLQKYFNKIGIQRGPSVKYILDNKNKIYHSDFYIPSLNLIIECKNSYLVERDKYILEAKKKAVLDKGFDYILIVDKKYEELNGKLQGL